MADELVERRIAAMKWLESAFAQADFDVLENKEPAQSNTLDDLPMAA
jgi:hypothetical protein